MSNLQPIKEVKEVMEPVIYNGEPRWLFVKQKKVIHDSGRNAKAIVNNPDMEPPETVTAFKIKKQGLWQCQKCGCIIESNPSEPIACYEDQGGCGRTATFKPITKIIKTGIWKLPIWEENEVDPFEIYDTINNVMHELVIFPEEIYYKIFALWIISTWKQECWETVGFPVFRGIIGSGKTRALNVIQALAYRSVPAAIVSFSALSRLSEYWNISITIDEANNRLNPKYESGAKLLDFIKQSYKKGSVYISSDLNDQKEVITTHNFGFKAFAGEKTFNAALVSRGIDVFMEKSIPPAAKMEYLEEELSMIRTMLLNYKYKTDNPPDLGRSFILTGRTREVYESIISTGMHIGQEVDDIIEFASEKEKEMEEEMQGTIEYEILQIIKNYRENETLDDAPEAIKISDICDGLGWEDKKDKQKLGYRLKNMGLKTKRKSIGKVIVLTDHTNSRRLGYLYRRYRLTQNF